MKKVLVVLMCMGLVTMASAELLTITDGGSGSPYGDAWGFVLDVDTTFNNSGASTTGWGADLVAGQQYRIDSISVWEASNAKNPPNATPVYLSVFDTTFAGFDGDTSAEHLGYSDNAINHAATPDTTKITYTFTNLIVTAGSDGWGGIGRLFFTWDDNTVRNNLQASGGVHPLQRIDSNPVAANYGAAIWAFGAIQSSRVPEVEVSMTLVPEPATMVLLGLGSLLLRRKR